MISKLRILFSMPVLLALLLSALLMQVVQNTHMTKGEGMTQLELRISEALSGIEGVSEVEVVIRTRVLSGQKSVYGEHTLEEEIPCGAVAVVQGAENPLTRLKLTQALCALLALSPGEVDVLCVSGGK